MLLDRGAWERDMDTEKPGPIFLKTGQVMSFVNACPAQGMHSCILEAGLPFICPSPLATPLTQTSQGQGRVIQLPLITGTCSAWGLDS